MTQASKPTKAKGRQESSGTAPSVDALREVYDRTNGNVAATARHFNRSSSYIRDLLVEHDIHELQERPLAAKLEELNPDDVGGEAAL